ncbi:alpha/beta fold hydrolase [Streptomyces viridochromogenes]|uniref:alpha/beta fold hydrolase n=1 Tax=Streptomyces viridochromogenes TaxID=1938 RepID=UPI001F44B944|nr:alpha/beta hydrolase [Streptomyces viridochromogenes]
MTTDLTSYGAQLKAIRRRGLDRPHDLSVIHQPVLVANGESDRMVPTQNSVDLARRVPNGELVLYPDAGHGGIFQFHGQFVETALEFLERQKACGAVVVWVEDGASGSWRPLGERLEAPVH